MTNKIINNKRAYSARDYFIAALFFGGAIALIALMISSAASEYSNTDIVDEEFSAKYDRTAEYATEINNSLTSLQNDPGLVSTSVAVFKSSFAFIKFLLNTLSLIGEPTSNFVEDFNVPTQVAGILFTLAISIITITIILRILSSITLTKF